MAITAHSMELIAAACERKGRAAALGYPDLLLNEGELMRYVGPAAKKLPKREDSDRIIKWHGNNAAHLAEVAESRAFFKVLGYELDVFDIAKIRGDEIFIDLNNPLWPQYRQKYALVIDPGTCEHCFHVGQAAMNVADMCESGGHIVQGLPLNAYNHGFYCISPTWVKDFYESNGFEIQACFGVSGNHRFPIEFRKRFRVIPENSFMLIHVRRNHIEKLKVPTQWKYQ